MGCSPHRREARSLSRVYGGLTVTSAGSGSGVGLTDVLRAMSVATDLGLGQPVEHLERASRIALRLGRRLGLDDAQLQLVYEVSLLTYVGCPVYGDDVASVFGDDIDFRSRVPEVDLAGFSALVFMLRRTAGSGGPVTRVRRLSRFMATTGRDVIAQMADHCAAAGQLGSQLGLDREACTSIQLSYARYDGRGHPPVAGDDIPLPARIAHVAEATEVFHRTGGTPAAADMAHARAGTHFDPDIVAALGPDIVTVFNDLDQPSPAPEPSPRPELGDDELDRALEALGDFSDLRCPWFAGHARSTADLATTAARQLQLPDDTVRLVYRAALVHDMGRAGIPGPILAKPGPLTSAERERVRLHSYLVERMFTRPEPLRRIGTLAAAHHERNDGTGYHRGLAGSMFSLPAQILAAADAFCAMTSPRPHRPPMTADEAATALLDDANTDRLDPNAVDAVLVAAGRTPSRARSGGPGGLTARETEVLTLIARGLPNKAVGRQLGITAKTVNNHVEHIYAKIDVSSRAAAALWAMRHGLLPEKPEPMTR